MATTKPSEVLKRLVRSLKSVWKETDSTKKWNNSTEWNYGHLHLSLSQQQSSDDFLFVVPWLWMQISSCLYDRLHSRRFYATASARLFPEKKEGQKTIYYLDRVVSNISPWIFICFPISSHVAIL